MDQFDVSSCVGLFCHVKQLFEPIELFEFENAVYYNLYINNNQLNNYLL